jgi:hypothetical protein
VTASSITHNLAIGASGSNGGDGGDGLGGGLYNGGNANLSYTTIEFNKAEGGAAGSGGSDGQGAGGGAYNAGMLAVLDSIFCDNSPDNLFGPYTDEGGNTIC